MDEAAQLFLLMSRRQRTVIEQAVSRLHLTPGHPELIESALSELRKAFMMVQTFLQSNPLVIPLQQSPASCAATESEAIGNCPRRSA